jgi:hypothetical protein
MRGRMRDREPRVIEKQQFKKTSGSQPLRSGLPSLKDKEEGGTRIFTYHRT